MSYYRCGAGHVFPTKRIHMRMLRSRNMASPRCPLCGDGDCVRIDREQWMRATGRMQRNHNTKKKTLRNRFS